MLLFKEIFKNLRQQLYLINNQHPSLLLLIFIILSIIIGNILQIHTDLNRVTVVISILLFLPFFKIKFIKLLFLLLMTINVILVNSNRQHYTSLFNNHETINLSVKYLVPPSFVDSKDNYHQTVISRVNKQFIKLTLISRKPIKPGEVIYGDFSIIHNNSSIAPWNIKSSKINLNREIYGVISAKSNCKRIINNSIKNSIYNYINNFISNGKSIYSTVFYPLILADKSNLNFYIKEIFIKSGMVHYLAFSGMHITIILLILITTFRFLPIDRNFSIFFALLGIWSIIFITGPLTSVLRSLIMATIILIAPLFKRRSISINTLLFTASIYLIFSPTHIFLPGFQLSFVAVLSIITYYNRLSFINNNILKWSIFFFTMPIITFIATAPILMYHFNMVYPFSPLFNIIILPILSILFQLLTTVIILSTFLPALYSLHLLAFVEMLFTLLIKLTSKLVIFIPSEPYQLSISAVTMVVALIILFTIILGRGRLIFIAPYFLLISITLFIINDNRDIRYQTISYQSKDITINSSNDSIGVEILKPYILYNRSFRLWIKETFKNYNITFISKNKDIIELITKDLLTKDIISSSKTITTDKIITIK